MTVATYHVKRDQTANGFAAGDTVALTVSRGKPAECAVAGGVARMHVRNGMARPRGENLERRSLGENVGQVCLRIVLNLHHE